MSTTLTKHDDLNASIHIVLTPEEYLPEYEKQLKTINKKVAMPGFRPGHVPKALIEKNYGESTLYEIINKEVTKSLNTHITENKIDLLGQPIANEDSPVIERFAKGETFNFIFDIGLAPVFEPDFGVLGTFNLPKLQADDKMLDEETESIRKRYGKYESIPKVDTDNDIVRLTLTELAEDGSPLEGGVQKDVPFLISVVKDEPTKQLLLSAEKEMEFKVNVFNLFNDDHKEMEHALSLTHDAVHDLGQQFSAKVLDITRSTPSEMNTELWDKVFGAGKATTEEEFRALLKEDLEEYLNQQGEHILEHEVTDAVMSNIRIDLPDAFMKRFLINNHPEHYNTDNVDEKYAQEAAGLRWQLIKEKVAEKYEVKVEDREVQIASEANARAMFAQYGLNTGIEDAVRSLAKKELEKEDGYRKLFDKVLSQKVVRKMKDLVTVLEQPMQPEEYFATIKEHNEKHHQQHEHAH